MSMSRISTHDRMSSDFFSYGNNGIALHRGAERNEREQQLRDAAAALGGGMHGPRCGECSAVS